MNSLHRCASACLVLSLLLIEIVGCNPTPSSSPPSSSPPPDEPNSAIPSPCSTLPLPPIDTAPAPPTPVLAWFLIDRSESMNRYCTGTQRQVLWQLADFFLSLGANVVTEDMSLYVGVEWLGPYETRLLPTLVSDLPRLGGDLGVTPGGTGSSNTNEYDEALEGVLAATTNFTGTQSIVLLTDGTFSGDNKEKILSALQRLCLREVGVYVILCNEVRDSANVQRDIQFWQLHTRAVYDIDAIADWLPGVTQGISGGSWPIGVQTTPSSVWVGGWLTGTGAISVPAVPGDVSSVSAYVLDIPLAESLPSYWWRQSSSADAPFLLEGASRLLSTGTLDISPRPSCVPHNEIYIRHEGRGVGFYWAEFTRPEVSMLITPSVSINNEGADIEVALENILPEWAPCYHIRLQTSEGSPAPSNFDADLRAHLTWVPSAGEPRTEQGCVELLTSVEILNREACSLQVVFEPYPVNNHVQAEPYGGMPYKYRMEFQFQYAQESPEVLLCTSKDENEIRQVNTNPVLQGERGRAEDGGSLQCPSPNRELLHFGSRECYIYQIVGSNPLSSTHVASVQFEPGENHLTTVRVQMYEFLWEQNQCGYQTLVFRWPESSNTHAITWVWEYDDSRGWDLWRQ